MTSRSASELVAGRDPLAALEKARSALRKSSKQQVAGLLAPIVSIRHGRGNGTYTTRWWTVVGEVVEHEETTYGISNLRRLLRDTVRRDDAERIVQHVVRGGAL